VRSDETVCKILLFYLKDECDYIISKEHEIKKRAVKGNKTCFLLK
jgi:hypothetical protein